MLAQLPRLLQAKSLRREVDALPELEFSEATLRSEEAWRRAYVLLCFLGQAYVWMEGQAGLVDKIPKKLAVPWVNVSQRIGMQPVVTYAATVFYNVCLLDPSKGYSPDNMRTCSSFTGAKDESWFFVVHSCVEVAAAPGLAAMASAFRHMAASSGRRDDHAPLCEALRTIKSSVQEMQRVTHRMYEGCNATFFFVTLRPYLAGFKALDAFPEGMVYEGVDPTPRQYYGGSGAQSSAVYALDMFLGTKHSSHKTFEYVMTMREYMPRKHSAFLEKLGQMPPVRKYCKDAGNVELVACYNEVVDALAKFRSYHIVLVTRYIVNQVRHSVNPTLDTRGTGGTEFDFLKRVRDDTAALKITIIPPS